MQPNKERIQLWVEALESGEYAQTTGSLREKEMQVGGKWRPLGDVARGFDGPVREAYCCLGVAAEVALSHGFDPNEMDWDIPCLSPGLQEWYGFDVPDPLISPEALEPITAVRANDQKGWNFTQIAATVRETYLPDEDVAE